MGPQKTKPQFKGNVGIFLVCAELSKNNLIAMPTSRNTKGYDIVVLNPETNKSIGLQVKCTDKKEFPVMTSYWRDFEKKIEGILCDFVFVDISNPDKPRYFLLSDAEIKNLLKSKTENYLSKYKNRYNLTLKEILEREKNEERKPQLWAVNLSDLEKYEGKWETIFNKIRV
jgi:hypothetical protein